jgi:hypothetical protein
VPDNCNGAAHEAVRSVEVTGEVVAGVFIAGEQVVAEAVNLDVSADGHIGGRNKLIVLVHVLVLRATQEGSLDYARVLLRGLIDRNRVVRQEVAQQEAAVDILGHARVEPSRIAEHLLVVVHSLEEVTLGLLGDQVVDVAEGVLLLAETIVGRNLLLDWGAGRRHLDGTQLEELAILAGVVLLGVLVNAGDVEGASEGKNAAIGLNLVAGQVVVSNEGEAGLLHLVAEGHALPPEQEGEAVTSIVGVVHLANLDGVVGEEVVHDEGEVFGVAEEAEHLAVVVEELLLGGYAATAERPFHEFLEVAVDGAGHLDLALGEGVRRVGLALGLGLSEVLNAELFCE